MNTKITLAHRLLNWITIAILTAALIAVPSGVEASRGGKPASFIVQGQTTAKASSAVKICGGKVTSTLNIITSVGAQLTSPQAACTAARPGVISVTPNGTVSVSSANFKNDKNPATDYADVTGADQVWQGNVSGANVAVAVVDTGIAPLNGLDRGTDGKKGRITGWVDLVSGKKQPHDPNGHGTHVAGVIANSDTGSDNEWNGTAPGVDLVGVRVLGEDGSGSYETVIRGIEWVVQNQAKYHIRVINLSLVAPAQSPYWADPLDRAVTAAWASGLVVVTAAGNTGPGAMTIGVPGNNPYAITVGAFSDKYTPGNFSDDYVTNFSSAGPTLDGFTKPDVVAPGAHMVSTMSPSSYVAKQYPDNRVDAQYFSMAGTSQASAVVSGVAALVISKYPQITPNEVKFRLTASALPWMSLEPAHALYSIWQQGYGRVNAPDAVFADLPGAANLGMDIQADLNGSTHYEGFSYYDQATHTFRLGGEYEGMDGGYGTWDGSYNASSGALGAWSGGLGAWSGALGAWSGGLGAWSGALGAWSGGLGAWSGGLGAWSGGLGAWSGGLGAWSGGFTTWAGGAASWDGSEPWAALGLSNASFVQAFSAGQPVSSAGSISTCRWVNE